MFQMMAYQNIQILNGYGIKKIVTTCPHCFNIIGNEYPALGGNYEVIHHATFLQQLLDEGVITEAEMSTHPDRNKLYNSIGGYMLPDIEIDRPVKLHDGDVLFLCTDGVWPELSSSEMLSTLRAYPLERAVKHMMDHAEFRAGQYGDNLSVVAVRYGEERFEAGELMMGDDLGLDGFTTQLKNLGGKNQPLPLTTDQELDQAMADIQTALAKYGAKDFT